MPLSLENIRDALIWTDQFCDRLPVMSTPVNLINIFLKCVISCQNPDSIKKNRYFTHVKDKSLLRCVTLLIPIIGNIIVGIYDIVKHCKKKNDAKKDVAIDLKANPSEKKEVVDLKKGSLKSEGTQKNSLDKIGGFSQGGNTCYIAATLQALRQIPFFRSKISPDNILSKRPNESDEAYESRVKVKQALYNLLLATDQGETIDGKTFRKFHQILYDCAVHSKNCRNLVSRPGNGGDQSLIFSFINSTLDIDGESVLSCSYVEDYDDNNLIDFIDEFHLSKEPKIVRLERLNPAGCNHSSVGDVFQQHVSQQLSKNLPMEFEFPSWNEEKHTLKLVAATSGTRSHTWAYLRDPNSPDKWVCCNDGRVKTVSKLPKDETINYLYYAEVD